MPGSGSGGPPTGKLVTRKPGAAMNQPEPQLLVNVVVVTPVPPVTVSVMSPLPATPGPSPMSVTVKPWSCSPPDVCPAGR